MVYPSERRRGRCPLGHTRDGRRRPTNQQQQDQLRLRSRGTVGAGPGPDQVLDQVSAERALVPSPPLMVSDGLGWSGMDWDGLGWSGMHRDGLGWSGMVRDGLGWSGMVRDA